MSEYGYGLWPLAVINSLVFTGLAASFFPPKTKRDRIGGRRGTVSASSGRQDDQESGFDGYSSSWGMVLTLQSSGVVPV